MDKPFQPQGGEGIFSARLPFHRRVSQTCQIRQPAPQTAILLDAMRHPMRCQNTGRPSLVEQDKVFIQGFLSGPPNAV
jgi:hypothetical protein